MMTPANYGHASLEGWLRVVLSGFAEHHDLGVVVGGFQIRLATQRRRREPDVFFVCKDRLHLLRATHFEGTPDLVVEIVSPDSQARDWREKYLEYEAAGVREYWVIDPMAEHVEVYFLTAPSAETGQPPATARYLRIEEKDGVIASEALRGLGLRIAWLWPATRPKALEALRQLGVVGPGG
jgi:Uma2 family endonuclease